MNFLAHAYLSFGLEEILVGNFIADFVRGKELEKYPKKVQLGIRPTA
jgi:acyl carrier protein phosphodiesterase